jgi:hypothetical protein
MKKLLFILSVSLLTFSLSSFKKYPGTEPGSQIIAEFKTDYPLVNNVKWELKGNIYVARFFNTNNEKCQLAYYNEEAEFLGQVWLIQLKDTPKNIQPGILNGIDTSAIKSIFLFMDPDGYPKFYATIVSDGRQILKEVDAKGESLIIRKKRVSAI